MTAPVNAATLEIQRFEGDGFGDWKVEGSVFGLAPISSRSPELIRKVLEGHIRPLLQTD
jgi:hypothetical protein